VSLCHGLDQRVSRVRAPTTELRTLQRLAGWSSPTPTGCDQGVFVRDLLVDVIDRAPMPPYPRR